MTFVDKQSIRVARHGTITLHTELEEDSTVFFGLWAGPCKPHHGMSRSRDQYYLISQSGGEVFTREAHDFPEGARVRYRTAVDKHGIESHAVGVELVESVAVAEAVEPKPEPVAKVAAPKVLPRNKGR